MTPALTNILTVEILASCTSDDLIIYVSNVHCIQDLIVEIVLEDTSQNIKCNVRPINHS